MYAIRSYYVFFFSMGVQTIIIIASLFGSAELGITGAKLIITILIIQVVAILGAILFGKVSTKYGNRTSLMWMLFIWIFVCVITSYSIHYTKLYDAQQHCQCF